MMVFDNKGMFQEATMTGVEYILSAVLVVSGQGQQPVMTFFTAPKP